METNLYAQKPLRRPKPFAWTPEIIQKYSNIDNLKKPVYVPGKRIDGSSAKIVSGFKSMKMTAQEEADRDEYIGEKYN